MTDHFYRSPEDSEKIVKRYRKDVCRLGDIVFHDPPINTAEALSTWDVNDL